MKTLLCVEDESHILQNHINFLTGHGYAVLTAETAALAREQLAARSPDAILLDVMLPDGNGLELLTEWRSVGIKTPIIMLTAWGKPSDISTGYRLGATAYLSKPFDYDAVLAVLEEIFRSADNVPERITRGALSLDMISAQAFLHGEDLLLSHKEFSLFLLFVQHEGREMSADYLYEKVWGQQMGGDRNVIKVTVSRLRSKIKDSGYTIKGKRGEGYSFEAEEQKTAGAKVTILKP